MASPIRQHAGEVIAGLVVVAIAAGFLAFALGRDGSADRYLLTARFPDTSGVSVGTEVRLSGVTVGAVTGQTLDPATFQSVLTLAVDEAISLPADTAAAITSDGLLGGAHVKLIPGGDPEPLRAGDEIADTQGATDLMGLIGAFINRSGDSGASTDSADGAP